MRRNDGTFEEDIQCIVDPQCGRGGIYISNLEAAANPDTLLKHKIGAVVTAAKGKNMANLMPKHIEYLYIPAVDHQSFDLSQYFEVCNRLLLEEGKRTNVLVHCMAGVSRSVTLVIAFLMFSRKMTFLEAFRLISPNSSFLKQLQQYESSVGLQQPKRDFQQSTSTSWYSKSPQKCVVNEMDYDKRLKAQIRRLLSEQKGVAAGR